MLVVEHGGDTMLPRIGARCIVTKSHARRRRSTAQRSLCPADRTRMIANAAVLLYGYAQRGATISNEQAMVRERQPERR
jgi:hypothetical protein